MKNKIKMNDIITSEQLIYRKNEIKNNTIWIIEKR